MSRAFRRVQLLGALVTVGLASFAGGAHADGFFFNEGLGPGAGVRKEMAQVFESSGISLRVGFGKRVGNWSVEGVLFGSNLDVNEDGEQLSPLAGMSEMTALSYGGDFRYYFPLSKNVDAYARAGLHGVSLVTIQGYADPMGLGDYGGRGYDLGVGVQWTIRPFEQLPNSGRNPFRRMEVGLWADYTEQIVRLHKSGSRSLDGNLEMWTFGIAIGSEI